VAPGFQKWCTVLPAPSFLRTTAVQQGWTLGTCRAGGAEALYGQVNVSEIRKCFESEAGHTKLVHFYKSDDVI